MVPVAARSARKESLADESSARLEEKAKSDDQSLPAASSGTVAAVSITVNRHTMVNAGSVQRSAAESAAKRASRWQAVAAIRCPVTAAVTETTVVAIR